MQHHRLNSQTKKEPTSLESSFVEGPSSKFCKNSSSVYAVKKLDFKERCALNLFDYLVHSY